MRIRRPGNEGILPSSRAGRPRSQGEGWKRPWERGRPALVEGWKRPWERGRPAQGEGWKRPWERGRPALVEGGTPSFPGWVLVLAIAWAAPAAAQTHLELVCPCTVETSNLTSIDVHFGVTSLLDEGDTGPLVAELEGRRRGGDGGWRRLGTAHLPAVAAEATVDPQNYTVPFRQRREGTWELRLRLEGDNHHAKDSIYWVSEPVEINTGGGSFSSVYFDGTPTVSIANGNGTLYLPAIKNTGGGTPESQVSVVLVGTTGLGVQREQQVLATHDFSQDLSAGGEIAATNVTVSLNSSNSHDYLQLQIRNSDGNVLAYQTVGVPQGESLPVRAIATADADILVDGDEDGVSDVNERLMDTDPNDAESKPGASTIDVLALYSPGFAETYEGEPSTRIRHVLTLADVLFSDSGVDAGLRLVGISELEVDEADAFTEPDPDTTRELLDLHGADLAVMFRRFDDNASTCGWTYLGGHLTRGTGVYDFEEQRVVHVFGDCGASTTAHEIGHLMGLGHSYAQDEVGTFRWSRGHGVADQFVTIMAYASAYGFASEIDKFSDPEGDCEGSPCGVAIDQPDGAHAVTTLNATRFQVANFAEAKPDSDEDGFVDPVDAFPEDATEHLDTDGDGTGDNTDSDDDGDGVADVSDLFPLDPSEWADSDGDGTGNNGDAFPADRFESADSDGDGVGDNGDRFPRDPTETVDTDNDGVGNNADAFPFDTRDWLDSDGDGTGDNADSDDDNDGVADVSDHFPRDTARDKVSSYRFVVTHGSNQKRSLAPAGDIDGDGKGDFLIGLVHYDNDTENAWSSVAYLIAGADLGAADAADGAVDRSINLAAIANQPGSWKFIGEADDDQAGHSVAAAGDIDGDGKDEVLIGAPGHDAAGNLWNAGAVYVVSPTGLTAADAADGETDGVVNLGNIAARDDSWKIIGESLGDQAGASVGLAGDLNGDDREDLFIGARRQDEGHGAVYVLSTSQLSAADEADGSGDGILSLGQVAARPGSWKLTGQDAGSQVGGVAPAPAGDNAGNAALLVTSDGYKGGEQDWIGAVYLVSSADLASIDLADGNSDGVAELGRVAAAANSWQFIGKADSRMQGAVGLGDIDGDNLPDVFLESMGRAFLISGADLADLDKDDDTDGVIRPHGLDAPNSWEATGHLPQASRAAAGHLDGDDLPDLAVRTFQGAWLVSGTDLVAAGERSNLNFPDIPSPTRSWQAQAKSGNGNGHGVLEVGLAGDVDGDGIDDALMLGENNQAYLLISTDLRVLDDADARTDGRIDLQQLEGDTDGDGIEDLIDDDDDNDGYRDSEDVFPHDAADWADIDFDGVGDNSDAFPFDWREQFDTDGDGTGDNADSDDDGDGVEDSSDEHPLDTDDDGTDNALDDDDDGDGVADTIDRFPLDPAESVDTDGDGTGNNADSDDDNDGVVDASDALPLDPDETADTDSDGVGDNADAFPNNAEETADTDGDGTGDNADSDDDGDGVPDTTDAFPNDAAETADTDSDGVGDNGDAFPNDAAEWADTDGDGTGDNADTNDDGDAYTDAADTFPLDSARTRLFHYRLTGENAGAQAGNAVSTGDIDGDGKGDALIGAPGTTPYILSFLPYGAAYAASASASDLDVADAADGSADGTLRLEEIAQQPSSNAVTGSDSGNAAGTSVAFIGDINRDGKGEWMVGAPYAESGGAAYLVSPANLDTADAINGADGVTNLGDMPAQSGSWAFVGEDNGDQAGYRVATAGDVNGDGNTDFLIGAPGHGDSYRGGAYLVSGAALSRADSADGITDGRIDLARNAARADSWTFLGESDRDEAGTLVAPAGDIDGDGMPDLIIAAPYHSTDELRSAGAVYLIAAADLAAADLADDTTDGVISLANVSAQAASWKLLGEAGSNFAGRQALTADTDGDGNLELIVGAPGNQSGHGAVYVVPIASLQAADDADGTSDRVVNLSQVAALANAYKFTGDQASFGLFGRGSGAGGALAAADLDGDGSAELVVAAEDYQESGQWCPGPGQQRQSGAVYVVSGEAFAQIDGADGQTDGVARLANVAGRGNSWQLLGEPTDRLGGSLSAGADLDGDGRNDLVMGGPDQFRRYGNCGQTSGEGVAVMLSGADLAAADRRDGATDGVVDFEALRLYNRSVDFDFDGAENTLDSDDDNDDVADSDDAFPLDPEETGDNDFDGIGDNADPDDDNDGTTDRLDAFAFDPYETADTDGDGTGDNADSDDDGDGTADVNDAFPLDASETADSDGDGIGDNADADPDNAVIDTDGDGIADVYDIDNDGDGVNDADDPYPLDATKSDLYFYRIAGKAIALPNTDFDGDGKEDLVVSPPGNETILVSSADLETADSADQTVDHLIDLDGISTPANSWKLDAAQHDRIFPAGDIDSDGKDDLIVHNLLVSASSLAAEDDAFGTAGDRLLRLTVTSAARDSGIWRLRGSRLDWGVFSLADLNADGRADLLVGAPWRQGEIEPYIDAVYLASGADWQSADSLDGSDDGNIRLDELAARSGSWKIESETDIAMGASISSAGDVNGDGHVDLMIGAPEMAFGTNPDSGGVILLSGAAMSSLDTADGETDGVIEITQGSQTGAWKLGGKDFDTGESISPAGDVDGDGLDDLLIKAVTGVYLITGASIMDSGSGNDPAATGSKRFAWLDSGLGVGDVDGDGLADFLLVGARNAYLVSGRDLQSLGGSVNFDYDAVPPYSWRLTFQDRNIEFKETASLADLDGDGSPELVLPAYSYSEDAGGDSSYIISATELAALDTQDGKADSIIHLDQLAHRWSD